MRSFLDTNVLVYADAADEPVKQRRALALIREHRLAGTGVLSVQVLQEYANVALRRLGLPAPLVQQRLKFYAGFDLVTTNVALLGAGIDLHVLRQIAFYDALVVQAAIISGCGILFSEDMQNGAVVGGVRIVDPFRP